MVMVASYVGTLVAFLTVENNVYPFSTVEELYKHKSIAYGAKKGGSTADFFKVIGWASVVLVLTYCTYK